MPALTPNQRKAAERARKRKAGLVAVTYWLPPAIRQRVTEFVNKLLNRGKQDENT